MPVSQAALAQRWNPPLGMATFGFAALAGISRVGFGALLRCRRRGMMTVGGPMVDSALAE